jgi:hypothetical protein
MRPALHAAPGEVVADRETGLARTDHYDVE